MRLRALDLHRYGHLSDTVLSFPSRAALCVVYGPNEAGKSTALTAIADALYGIHDRSPAAFLHGQQTRVGVTLAAQDGTNAQFVRRKGRKNTLLDGAEQSLPESAIQRFLGGVGRETFEGMFGLNGERLRAGATTLAQLGGSVGESLFAAGTGLTGLRAALEKIDAEARMLVGDGRGKRRLAEAIEGWHAARRARDEREIRPASWQEAERAHDEAVARIQDLRNTATRLDADASRLERVRRMLPILSALDAARATREALAGTPRLPADAAETLRRLTAARGEGTREQAREAEGAARLAGERGGIARAPNMLAAQDLIDALSAKRAVLLQAEKDLPGVERESAEKRSAVAQAVRDLGIDVAAEDARDAVPPQPARRAVQRLLTENGKLAQRRAAAAQALAAGEARRARAEAALADLPPAPDPALLRASVDKARAAGPLDEEHARRTRLRDDALRARDTALARLPLWERDAAALAACPVPLAPATAEAADRLRAAAERAKDTREAVAQLRRDIGDAEDRMAQLARGETVPTPAALAQARSVRDRRWRVLRAAIETGVTPEAGAADEFEQLRDAADRLADRRADDAQRVSDYLAAHASHDSLRTRLADSVAQADAAACDHAEATAGWRALWQPAGIVPESPDAMVEWTRQRADVLSRHATAEDAARACDELAQKREAASALLRSFVPEVAQDATLAALLTASEVRCTADERARDTHRESVKALGREAAALPELRRELEAAEAALAAWNAQWRNAVAAIGLPGRCETETAGLALDAWHRIEVSAEPWRTAERRVRQMRDSINAFAAELRDALARSGAMPSDDPPLAAAARLARELAAAREAEAKAGTLTERIAGHEARAREAAERLRAADAELAALRTLAGAADDAALEEAIARAERRDAAIAEIERATAALASQGDGRDEAALRAEAEGADADEIAAQLQAIREQRQETDAARDHATAERTRREEELAAMERGRDAATAAQDMQHALADAASAAERYARLHVARTLLHAGIARFRREQQGPLLKAAGAHFALLTGGHYASLITDEGERGEAVIHAVRDNGTECPLAALSDGARDQLYLALRVAIVEAHCMSAEPLPFIADDLLVHFDDARAAAALRLLTELGQTAQVILFTHHEHIAALAAGQDASEVAVICFGEEAPARMERIPTLVG